MIGDWQSLQRLLDFAGDGIFFLYISVFELQKQLLIQSRFLHLYASEHGPDKPQLISTAWIACTVSTFIYFSLDF